MMNLAEYRRSNTRLADFLPWCALVDEGIVLNKDGSFQRTAKFRGPDLDSAVPAELVGVAGRLNNALRRLGSGWAVFVEAQRQPASQYPQGYFPDVASALVDVERRAQFEEEGAHYESNYFLTFLYLPPPEDTARAEGFLYEGRDRRQDADARQVQRGFVDRTDRVLGLVEGLMPELGWIDDEETLTYLHSTVSTKRQRVRVPEIPVYLDAVLADQPLTGGLEPMLGNSHLRVLTVVGFPTVTTPGILDELNRLAFPYRWSTRAIMLDKTDATRLLTKIRRQWFAKRKSIAAILKEVMTNEASTLLDTDAHNKAMDADAALQELGSDAIGQAFVTATVTVWDDDPRIVDEKLRLVEKVIQGRDFTCIAESVNAVEAWLGAAALAQLGAGFTLNSIMLKYSRSDETQADVMGTQILYDSGYDPRAMAQFFEKLQAADKGGQPVEFFSDHPNPDHRLERVDQEIEQLGGSPRGTKTDSREFQDIKRYVLSRPAPPVKGSAPRLQADAGSGDRGQSSTTGLRILSASYGAKDRFADVRQLLQSRVQNNRLDLQVTNTSMGGDPIVGEDKTLRIRYEWAGRIYEAVAQEDQRISIPSSQQLAETSATRTSPRSARSATTTSTGSAAPGSIASRVASRPGPTRAPRWRSTACCTSSPRSATWSRSTARPASPSGSTCRPAAA
jgi:hypothetical protein